MTAKADRHRRQATYWILEENLDIDGTGAMGIYIIDNYAPPWSSYDEFTELYAPGPIREWIDKEFGIGGEA